MIGASVVVVAADRLVSVHVHTDDIGAALEAGSRHGRPHNVRVEDLHEGVRRAADGPGGGSGSGPVVATGLVGDRRRRHRRPRGRCGRDHRALSAAPGPTVEDLRIAVARTGHDHVSCCRPTPELAGLATQLDPADAEVTVVAEVDDVARLVAALAVLDPSAPDPTLLAEVATAVRSGSVTGADDRWTSTVGDRQAHSDTPLAALADLLEHLGADTPELVSLLLGRDVGVVLREAAAAAVARRWPSADLDVIEAGLGSATFVVGVE